MMHRFDESLQQKMAALKGPIVVFGAGGFIGLNLLNALLSVRKDVIGVSQDSLNNWRLIANKIPSSNLISIDILQPVPLRYFMQRFKPATIFNLAAYGAYSKQKEYDKIYQTNFVAAVDLVEIAKEVGFEAFIYAGSSSEYGINSAAPNESAALVPNSHYAVSKAATSNAIKYYGLIEKLPIAHLRLYSVYGQWEEPDRLVPVLISKARKKSYPHMVNPEISRDFVFIDDVISAFIMAALNVNNIKGQAINIGTGTKTTIRQLAHTVQNLFDISELPVFGNMPDRLWDLNDWYSDPSLAFSLMNWKAQTDLNTGLLQVAQWQDTVGFDNAFWNWNK